MVEAVHWDTVPLDTASNVSDNLICALTFRAWLGLCSLFSRLQKSPPRSLGALYAKLIYPNISTALQQPLLFNINNFVNGNLLIHKRLCRRSRLLGGSSRMNVKNPTDRWGAFAKEAHGVFNYNCVIVCVCACVLGGGAAVEASVFK